MRKPMVALFAVFALLLVPAAAQDMDETMDTEGGAMVVIDISALMTEFGGAGDWEGSLYAGAVAGEETSGRFTEWVIAEDGVVVFHVPQDVREGDSFELGQEAYIRVRSVGDDAYPSFDFVGLPFMLTSGTHVASVGFQGVNTVHAGMDDTQVTVSLEDFREGFGAVTNWEASIYAGAMAGEETSGRYTEWVVAEDGMVTFMLPEAVREGNEASFGAENDTYIRVRSAGDETYPSFDFVARPFTLNQGNHVATTIVITGAVSSN